MPTERLSWLRSQLASLEGDGLRRTRAVRDGATSVEIAINGEELVHFGANDYLSLAADPRVVEAVQKAAKTEGWGSGASPLVAGRTQLHDELEQRLARLEGTEAALVFGSGYAANTGSIPAIVGEGDAIFADAKNHASLIDGCRLSRARTRVYHHNDVTRLTELLERFGPGARRRLIVTDGLFSMDGDLAPLDRLAELADRFDCMLMVDEAHATGVLGQQGRGVSEQLGVAERVDIRVGTLSKALGGVGGFVAGRSELIEWLANRARSYVFSTAPPTAACAAALAAVDLVAAEPHRRTKLLDHAADLRLRLVERGWDIGPSQSQIIPLRVGQPNRAMALADRLRGRGLFVPGIRPPSVPAGESLLRIGLCYGHTPQMIDQLLDALGEA